MKDKKNKTVSVILPVFNGELFIADAINSVLEQTIAPCEIIVIDDGSNDKTSRVVLGFGDKVKYVRKENGGVATARNLGLKYAIGKFIAFIDADDLWAKNKLEIQLNLIEKTKDLNIVIGFTQIIPITMNVDRAILDANPKVLLLYVLGCTLIKRSIFFEVGNFDEEMILSEDTDWFFRTMEAGIQIELHNDIVQFYRVHQNNITNDKKRNHLYQIKAYKKSLDRRRKLGKGTVPAFPKPNNLEEMTTYWKNKGFENGLRNE